MNRKQVINLIAVAIVLLLAYSFSSKRNQPERSSAETGNLLAGLELNKIAAVELVEAGGTLRLERAGEQWCATNAYNYPVDFGNLSRRLISLRDIKSGQIMRGMAFDADAATTLKLFDNAGKLLDELAIGGTRESRGDEAANPMMGGYSAPAGRYVRHNGQVYLLKESLDEWEADVSRWIDTSLTSVPASEVASIELSDSEGTVILNRQDGKLELVGLGEEEEFDSGKASGLDGALAYLHFSRVVDPTMSDDELGFTTGRLYRVTLTSGERYSVQLGDDVGGERYARLEADFAVPSTNEIANAASEKKVREANDKFQGWNYLIGKYAAGNMIRDRDEMVKAKVPETNEVAEVQATVEKENGE